VTRPETERVTMRRSDAAALLAGLGLLAVWLASTDRILRYLRPSMRPWIVLSGSLLIVLALAVAVSAWRDERAGHRGGHGQRARLVGWLIALPLVVSLAVDGQALGAYTIRQNSAFGVRLADFDLADHLRTHSFAGQTPQLELHQFLAAAHGDADQQRFLAETPVRLTGFVVGDGTADGFQLARLMIGCCAGDAVGLIVDVRGYEGGPLADDTWVEVTGSFVPAVEDAPDDGDGARQLVDDAPVVQLTSLRRVDEPDEPYEYPY